MTDSVLTKNQTKKFSRIAEGSDYKVDVVLRFDDRCGNGHNTFSITGTTYTLNKYDRWEEESGGCIHEQIETHYPEFSHLIPYHLCSTDGPMHYLANTIYLAGDRDYNGLKAGEFKPINKPDGTPIWEIKEKINSPITSKEKPDNLVLEYQGYGRIGEGKARELDAARRCAIWPKATDEELMSDDLKTRLENRLPQLLADFRSAMEGVGFTW